MSSSLLTGGIPISTWSAHESGSNQSCLQKSRVMSSLFGALKGKFPSGLVFPSSFSVYPFSITSLVFVLFFFKHTPWGLPLDWQSKNYDTKENFDGFYFCLYSFFFHGNNKCHAHSRNSKMWRNKPWSVCWMSTYIYTHPMPPAFPKHTCCRTTGSNLGWLSHQHIPGSPRGSDPRTGFICIHQSIRVHALASIPACQYRHVTQAKHPSGRLTCFWAGPTPSVSAGLS